MKLNFSLGIIVVLLFSVLMLSIDRNKALQAENSLKQQNIESLKDLNKQLADTTQKQALEVKTLRLTRQEFKDYKQDAEKTLKKMNLEIKNLKAVGQHSMELKIPIKGKLEINEEPEPSDEEYHRQDSAQIKLQRPFMATINIEKPFLKVTGSIVADSIDISVKTDVELDQAFTTIPKHRFLFWTWGVKGIKQTIRTENPYVNIKYSEYIEIE